MFSTFFRQALHRNAENLTVASFAAVVYGINGVLFCRNVNQLEKDNPGCAVRVESTYIPGVGPYHRFVVEKPHQSENSSAPSPRL